MVGIEDKLTVEAIKMICAYCVREYGGIGIAARGGDASSASPVCSWRGELCTQAHLPWEGFTRGAIRPARRSGGLGAPSKEQLSIVVRILRPVRYLGAFSIEAADTCSVMARRRIWRYYNAVRVEEILTMKKGRNCPSIYVGCKRVETIQTRG